MNKNKSPVLASEWGSKNFDIAQSPSRAIDRGQETEIQYTLAICVYNTIFSQIKKIGFVSLNYVIKKSAIDSLGI